MKTKEIIIKNGCLGVNHSIYDFTIGNTSRLPKIYLQDNIVFEYNQGSSLDCTLYAPITAISDLKNRKYLKDDIKRVVDLSYSRGRKQGEGWWTANGVKCVCDDRNAKNPNNPVAWYQISLLSEEVEDALNKNYTIVVTYRGNYLYDLDFLTDGTLDGSSFGNPTYGHATGLIRRGNNKIKDSYEGRLGKNKIPCNVYELKTALKDLVENNVYYPTAYVIVNIKDETRLNELKRLNEFRVEVENALDGVNKAIKHHSSAWEKTNDTKYMNELHKINNALRSIKKLHESKLIDIQKEFDKFE